MSREAKPECRCGPCDWWDRPTRPPGVAIQAVFVMRETVFVGAVRAPVQAVKQTVSRGDVWSASRIRAIYSKPVRTPTHPPPRSVWRVLVYALLHHFYVLHQSQGQGSTVKTDGTSDISHKNRLCCLDASPEDPMVIVKCNAWTKSHIN